MDLATKLKHYQILTVKALSLEMSEDVLPAFISNVFKEHKNVNAQILVQELDQRIENLTKYLNKNDAA